MSVAALTQLLSETYYDGHDEPRNETEEGWEEEMDPAHNSQHHGDGQNHRTGGTTGRWPWLGDNNLMLGAQLWLICNNHILHAQLHNHTSLLHYISENILTVLDC